jgi:hypothetical protein
VALLILAAACHQDTAPLGGTAKLLVSNSSCSSGTCTPIHVLMFPENQPDTPAGFWSLDLGIVSGASGCLIIPASASFHVTDAGTGATTTFTWTTTRSASIGSLAPDELALMASPSTGAFVPAREAGWSLALPGNQPPAPAAPCS